MPSPAAANTNIPSPSAGRRSELLSLSNALLYLVFCLLAGTGLAILYRLDQSGATLLGVARPEWVRVHAFSATSFLSLVAIHLWVNLPWLRSMIARLRWPTLVVVAMGATILALFLAAPVSL